MLLKNFQVGSRQILNNAAKSSFFALRFSKRASRSDKFTEWPKNKIRLTPEQYQRRLKECPKPSFVQLCCKKLFSKPEPKCQASTISDDYIKARQSLKLRIKNVVNFVEDKSRSISNHVKSRSDDSKIARAAQLDELLNKTTGKLDELIKLDVSYGCWMRKEMLLLNDEIKRSFDALERAIALNAKRITFTLTNLQDDVSMCVEQAERNLVACRRHDAPRDFAECVRKQSDEATKALDRVSDEARRKLEEIAKFGEVMTGAYETTAREVIEVNRKKADELSKYMERCIVQLKKLEK